MTSVDLREVEVIGNLENCLQKIISIVPRTYLLNDEPNYGFITNELNIDNCVFGLPDGTYPNGEPKYQTTDLSKLLPYLIGAIHELSAQVEELKARV